MELTLGDVASGDKGMAKQSWFLANTSFLLLAILKD